MQKPSKHYSLSNIGLQALKSVALSLLFAASANAEQIKIPLGQQGDQWNVERPRLGSSKIQVEARFGTPVTRTGPVGAPPIYTWEYELFNVFFEGDYVLHSVVKHQPKNN